MLKPIGVLLTKSAGGLISVSPQITMLKAEEVIFLYFVRMAG